METKVLTPKKGLTEIFVEKDTIFIIKATSELLNSQVKLVLQQPKTSTLLVLTRQIKEEKIRINIQVELAAPETHGEIWVRTVLSGKARINLKANLKVTSEAKNSRGKVSIKGLAVGKDIEWKVEPFLEIENNQISAVHKASLITFNDKQLNYLESRGLNKSEAENVLKESFFSEVLEKIPDGEAKQDIINKLNL